jgi:hypothetical protein
LLKLHSPGNPVAFCAAAQLVGAVVEVDGLWADCLLLAALSQLLRSTAEAA